MSAVEISGETTHCWHEVCLCLSLQIHVLSGNGRMPTDEGWRGGGYLGRVWIPCCSAPLCSKCHAIAAVWSDSAETGCTAIISHFCHTVVTAEVSHLALACLVLTSGGIGGKCMALVKRVGVVCVLLRWLVCVCLFLLHQSRWYGPWRHLLQTAHNMLLLCSVQNGKEASLNVESALLLFMSSDDVPHSQSPFARLTLRWSCGFQLHGKCNCFFFA